MAHPITLLMYHQVGAFAPMARHRSTYCDHRRFAAQMAWLKRWRYQVLTLDQAVAALAGQRPLPARAVVLTFDDGYLNFYQYAYPQLRRHGFPATVYLLSDYIGRTADWFAADGRDCPPLLDRARIIEMGDHGIQFGSHGVSHHKLAELDPQEAAQELVQSKSALEALLERPIDHFCYPYGSHSPTVVEQARQAGYRTAVTCVRAAARPGWDWLQLPRKAISYGDTLAGFAFKLAFKNEPKGRLPGFAEVGID